MATAPREIGRKHGSGAAGPGLLHDPPLTGHSSAAEVVLCYLRDQVEAIARCDPLVRRGQGRRRAPDAGGHPPGPQRTASLREHHRQGGDPAAV